MRTATISEEVDRTPSRAAVLVVVLAAQAMALIDLSIVNVAAPTIQRDVHTSGAGLQVVVSGYVVTYAMSLITGARLGDRVGHARVFRAGLVGFTLASLACGACGEPDGAGGVPPGPGARRGGDDAAGDEPDPTHVPGPGTGPWARLLRGCSCPGRGGGPGRGRGAGERRRGRQRVAADLLDQCPYRRRTHGAGRPPSAPGRRPGEPPARPAGRGHLLRRDAGPRRPAGDRSRRRLAGLVLGLDDRVGGPLRRLRRRRTTGRGCGRRSAGLRPGPACARPGGGDRDDLSGHGGQQRGPVRLRALPPNQPPPLRPAHRTDIRFYRHWNGDQFPHLVAPAHTLASLARSHRHDRRRRRLPAPDPHRALRAAQHRLAGHRPVRLRHPFRRRLLAGDRLGAQPSAHRRCGRRQRCHRHHAPARPGCRRRRPWHPLPVPNP